MTLFQKGCFTLRSGKKSGYKIECDALTEADWAGIAEAMFEEDLLPKFSATWGVPRGGVPLAAALNAYCTNDPSAPHLICEDVVTTGGSMERYRKILEDDPQLLQPPGGYVGVVFIARGKCPGWVRPLFQMALPRMGS